MAVRKRKEHSLHGFLAHHWRVLILKRAPYDMFFSSHISNNYISKFFVSSFPRSTDIEWSLDWSCVLQTSFVYLTTALFMKLLQHFLDNRAVFNWLWKVIDWVWFYLSFLSRVSHVQPARHRVKFRGGRRKHSDFLARSVQCDPRTLSFYHSMFSCNSTTLAIL